MKVCTCFLLFELFAYTNSISRIEVVNLPQETVREYSDEDSFGDTNNEDNDHNILTKSATVPDKNIKLALRMQRVETLTDFIQETVQILNTYEDTAFEDFFHILDNEIRKYHYRGCKFSELTQNSDTRRLLAGSLKLIRGKSVSFTRANINAVADMMRDETYDKNVKELLDYINSLYTNTEFHKVLNELKYYRNTKSVRTHNNLVLVIRNGVRAVLFNPYSELDSDTRKELKERIETFWKQFKNDPSSSAEMNDIPHRDPVINNFEVSENIMNEVKNLEPYYKNDPQVNSKNKRGRLVSSSIETLGEQSLGDETEKDESSNESGNQISNSNTDEILSGQSFDSSSNSIKNSQERHEQYNTERYMTLYTEEMIFKTKSTKETEIIPLSVNVMTRRPNVKTRSTTTSRESDVSSDKSEKLKALRANHDTELNISNSSSDTESGLTLESKQKLKVRANYDKQQKHGKADVSRAKSKQKNMEIISDAVIDVQLANTELLRSLGMFEPHRMDKNSRYDSTLLPKPHRLTKPVLTKSTIRPRFMRAQAEIKLQKPTAPTQPPSRYSRRNKPLYRTQVNGFRKNIALPLPNEGNSVVQFMSEKNQRQPYLRLSDNDTIGAEDFNTYVIERINVMENKLNELKQMNKFSFRTKMNDNNSNEVEARYVSDKFEVKDKVDSKRKDMKGNDTERLLNEDIDLNNEKFNDENDFPTRNNAMNTESPTNNSKSLNDKKKVTVNATVIVNKNTTQVTNSISKINVNVTKKLNKEVINSNITSSTISLVKVTNETKLESVVTTPTFSITQTMAVQYSEPSYYDPQDEENRPTVRNPEIESYFAHFNDGMNIGI